jgi:2-phosphoglycolate phosphatase
VRALLCDLDGTLVDSRRDLAAAVDLLFGDLGLPPLPPERVVAHVGRGARSLIRRCLDEVGAAIPDEDPRLRAFLPHYERVLLQTTRPFDGVMEGLAVLRDRGVRLAVVTNKPVDPARLVLEGLGMEGFFPVVLGGDSLPTRKPDPEMLLEAADRLGIEPPACLMLGDSDVDIDAARAAGMPALWCSWGGFHADRPARADGVVHRFGEVVDRFSP